MRLAVQDGVLPPVNDIDGNRQVRVARCHGLELIGDRCHVFGSGNETVRTQPKCTATIGVKRFRHSFGSEDGLEGRLMGKLAQRRHQGPRDEPSQGG